MQYSNGRILIFTKAPIPGNVKTRLMPELSAQECCMLHQELIRHTLKTVIESNLCDVELWHSSDANHEFFSKCEQDFDITLKQQVGSNLGERMHLALAKSLAEKDFAILIGTDCPSINKNHLAQTAMGLSNKSHNVILGPAMDGGYFLIGANKISASLFTNIDWGNSTVLKSTRINLQKNNFSWTELDTLSDIDRPQDLYLAASHFPNLSFLQPYLIE